MILRSSYWSVCSLFALLAAPVAAAMDPSAPVKLDPAAGAARPCTVDEQHAQVGAPAAPRGHVAWDARAVEHLLNRAGFGARPSEIQDGVKLGQAALVEKLVTQDHITLILGPYSSDNTIAAAAITSKLGAVMMADEGVAKVIWTSGNKGVVGPIMYDYQYMYPVVDALLAKRTGIKTVVMLHADDSFSVGVAEGAAAYMKSKGLQVVGNFQYPSATTDVSSIIAQARPLNADVMMSSGHIEDAILITRQAKQNGLNFKALAFTVAPPTPDYVRALGRDAEYVIGPAPWLPQVNFTDPYFGNTQKFVEAFKAQRGYVPDYHVGDAAEGVELLVQGMVKAGSTDPGKVSAAFLNTTYATIAGFVHFDNNWHEDNQLGAAIQIQNGQPVPIWPAKYLTNLKFPMPTWSQR